MPISRKSEEGQAFWKLADELRAKMDKWPEWKRNIRVTKYSASTDQRRDIPSAPDTSRRDKD